MTSNKVYIGKLPPDTNEDSLERLLQEQASEVPLSISLKKGGFAFIELTDQASAEKVIQVLNGYNFMGSQLLVEPSFPQGRRRSSKVLVSYIPNRLSCDEIKRLLASFGSLQNYEEAQGKNENTCSVYATYENQEQAQQAYNQLNGHQIDGSSLKVDFVMERGGSRSSYRGRGQNYRPGGGGGMPYAGGPPANRRPNDFPLRILVLSDMVGAIIGRAGGTIRQITQQSRARVDVHRKENAGSLEKVITIYGQPENCSAACQKILEVMQQEANNTNRGEIPLKILAHNNLVGRIIGKNGNTIKRIMEQTDTKITVSSNIHDVNSFNLERIVTIKGKLENTCKAEQQISTKLRQSYEHDLAAMAPQTLMFPGLHPMAMMSTLGGPSSYNPRGPAGPYGGPAPPMYNSSNNYLPMMYNPGGNGSSTMEPQKETVYLYIPNTSVGAIIGTGGSTIRDMISSSAASIKISQTNKEEPLEKTSERKVTIIGTPEAQWKAQFMIFKKVGFEGFTGPQEARLKVEILVPSTQVGRIIGKGGQTVRELQRTTHAIIKLPEESQTDSDETPVHIVGDFYSSQAAQRQIRALINRNMNQQQRRGARPPSQPPPVAAAAVSN